MLSVDHDNNTTNNHIYNKLTKTEEILLEMFNELPQKEKDSFLKAINTRKNELDQLYEEMKAVRERKGKKAS
ncbi:hypothetical protein QE177_12245 [Arsenophonus sp. aPb]|uniref:hypothetical protein n=1 Tax=Arsenophonus sp. aPb TaxID=3041619 RepID=UPI00246824C9|nr:hypothetical protein [Arsenophonus sp. aPb]WGL97946.1 hypothetical protein QE177_12245 [Arsenophonus sp. aPb]